jgi:hypothetical protein
MKCALEYELYNIFALKKSNTNTFVYNFINFLNYKNIGEINIFRNGCSTNKYDYTCFINKNLIFKYYERIII